eukprot:GILK01011505.1.p1 GENE.GILK01011505.1~~GILK01011505.1.p1  ORF type:complete len:660 (-),score=106.14 GILK01011505.1:44-2023(-)
MEKKRKAEGALSATAAKIRSVPKQQWPPSKATVVSLNPSVLLLRLAEGESLSFVGCALVRVISGKVNIYGYELRPSLDSLPVYAPLWSKAISMSAVGKASPSPMLHDDEGRLAAAIAAMQMKDSRPASSISIVLVKPMVSPAVEERVVNSTMSKKAREEDAQSSSDDNDSELDSTSQVETEVTKREFISELALPGFYPVDPQSTSTLQEPATYVDLAEAVLRPSVRGYKLNRPISVVVTGAKNTGKSSLCRYLMNRILSEHSQVAFLECDIGQTEFTAPGIIALHIVDRNSPPLGPPISHQLPPMKACYLGDVSPNSDPQMYIEAIQACFDTYINFRNAHGINLPIVINTCGWVKGLGLDLILSIIRYCRPQTVVQLQGASEKKKMGPLDPKLLVEPPNKPSSGPIVRIIEAVSSDESDVVPIVIGAADLRSQSLVTHLSPSLLSSSASSDSSSASSSVSGLDLGLWSLLVTHPTSFSVPAAINTFYASAHSRFLSQPPYRVAFSSLRLCVFADVPPSQYLYALNGAVVALAVDRTPYQSVNETNADSSSFDATLPLFLSRPPSPSLCDCVGLGVIRSIDTKAKCFYILTSVDSQLLPHVNTLIRGTAGIDLPFNVLWSPHSVGQSSIVPYVVSDSISGIGSGSVAMKSRNNIQRKSLA